MQWRVFPLHPDTPEEGMELSEMFAGRESMIEAMQARLVKAAAAEGLPLVLRSRTCNSRRAQELGKWAESQGVGYQFHRSVYHSYFVEGVNIGLIDDLVDIAASVGLSKDEARTILKTRSFAAAVTADWQRSIDLRITAVPTHIYGAKILTGFRSYDEFVSLMS